MQKILLVLVLASLVLPVMAVSDEELTNYALGVFDAAGISGTTTISISGNIFYVNSTLGEYSSTDIGSIGYQIWDLSRAAGKIVDKYPGQFFRICIHVYDKTGSERGFSNLWTR